MTNDETVVANQNVLDDESHDALPFDDVECVGGGSQPCQKRRESLCRSQKHGAVVGLIRDRLNFRAQRLLSLAKRRHSLAQLFKGYESFLVCVQNSPNALSNTSYFHLQTLLALLCWI